MTVMKQMRLIGETVDVSPKRKVHMSWNDDQAELIRTILTVYNEGRPIHLDPMYNKGVFYRKIPEPILKFDINPIVPGVERADARSLPLADESVSSVMLDPPFCIGASSTGIMKDRYSMLKNMKDLHELYHGIIKEAYRVLSSKGILIFKSQDVVSSAVKHPIHITKVYAPAIGYGFFYEDMLTLINHNPLSQAHRGPQQHTRSATCFFFVFRKGKLSVAEKRKRAAEMSVR